jgi:Plavaka transposase
LHALLAHLLHCSTVGAPHTADAFRLAEAKLRDEGRLSGGKRALCVALSSDKTQKRSVGQMQLWPMYASILNERTDARNSQRSKLLLGYIPVLKRRSGADKQQFADGCAKVFSACWKRVLEQIQAMSAAGAHITVVLADGITFTAVPVVIMFIGDHPELQLVCGVSSSWQAQFLCRMCWCTWSRSHLFYSAAQQSKRGAHCRPRTAAELLRLTAEAADKADTASGRKEALRAGGSLSGVPTAFLYYDGFGTAAGVLQATAQDRLHHIKGGISSDIIKMLLQAASDLPGVSASAASAVWSSRLVALPRYSDAATGRRFKQYSGDVLSSSTLTADHKLALVMALKFAVGEVADVFEADFHKQILQLLLAFEEMYLLLAETEQFSEADLDVVEQRIADFIKSLSRTFGPDSQLDYNIKKPKIHALSHIRQWIWLFGSWSNWCSSLYEQAHKRSKDHASRTNNKAQQERTMLSRDALQSSLHSSLTRMRLLTSSHSRELRSDSSSSVSSTTNSSNSSSGVSRSNSSTTSSIIGSSSSNRSSSSGSSSNNRSSNGQVEQSLKPTTVLVPAVGSGKAPPLFGSSAAQHSPYCILTPALGAVLYSKLQQFLTANEGVAAVKKELVLSHAGYKVLLPAVSSSASSAATASGTSESSSRVVLSAQCRDAWHGQGGRYDDVCIEYTDDSNKRCLGYAKLLCLLSYNKIQLAFVHWYFKAERGPKRPVHITKHYMKQKKLTAVDATDVVYVSAITASAHIIRDAQADTTERARDSFMAERYFLNNGNNLCL